MATDSSATKSGFAAAIAATAPTLDKIYLASGYAAAACTFLILLTIVIQIISRLINVNLIGLTTFAGYFMAASTFLGLPYALSRGTHIRIETISKLMGEKRFFVDLFAFAIGALVSIWFAYYACDSAYESYKINDISTDLDATPLWIPQSTMAIGSVLFALAMVDNFLTLLFTRCYRFQTAAQPAH